MYKFELKRVLGTLMGGGQNIASHVSRGVNELTQTEQHCGQEG